MQVIKYETNFKRNLFMKKTSSIYLKQDTNNEENRLINIYPSIEFQNIIGFGGALTRFYLL